jgi:hypothetical protein
MSALVGLNGMPLASASGAPPTPSATLEKQLRDALQPLDSLLDVVWVPTVFYNRTWARWEGRYALAVRWPQIDKRWQEVQSGKMAAADAYDIVGWLCEDMQDSQSVPTSLDGIHDRVLRLLGTMDNTRYPWKERFLSTIEKNKQRHENLKRDALDDTHNAAEHYYRLAKGVPQSTGANFDVEGNLAP